MYLVQTEAPTVSPVTLNELKQQLRITHDAEDYSLVRYIEIATDYCERTIDGTRAISQQEWRVYLPCFRRHIWLPKPPLQYVVSVNYLDPDGEVMTVDSDAYIVHTPTHGQGYVEFPCDVELPETEQRDDAIYIQFVCGYPVGGFSGAFSEGFDSQPQCPKTIKAAIMLVAGSLYEQRESHTDKPSNEVAVCVSRLLALNNWGHYS